jgi:hypothetical protein
MVKDRKVRSRQGIRQEPKATPEDVLGQVPMEVSEAETEQASLSGWRVQGWKWW